MYSSPCPLLQLHNSEYELQCCRSRLEVAESDLQAAEQERESLQRKVELLEKAMESPGSRLALRRILERYFWYPCLEWDTVILCVYMSSDWILYLLWCGGGGGGGVRGMNNCKVSLNLELQVLLQRNLQVVVVEDNNCLVK